MSRRKSIDVQGFSHGVQPIPAACRVGDIVMTGGIFGLDPATGTVPDDAEEQCELAFANLRRILEAAGASSQDIVKMTVWVKHPDVRAALNRQWLAMFPDATSRPARHTLPGAHLPANLLMQCDAMAVMPTPR
jgi:enamine deaminase RidA (YjgF/YER057c/UK114 family)